MVVWKHFRVFVFFCLFVIFPLFVFQHVQNRCAWINCDANTTPFHCHPRATTLQGVGSEQGIEEAIRTLLAAEQQELGGTSSGLFRAPPGAPEHATPPPPFTVHADLHTQTRTDGATARERSARAWRRATRAALYQPLLEPEPPAPTLQPVHSIDAHVRPGAAALYALGLMKQGAKGRQ